MSPSLDFYSLGYLNHPIRNRRAHFAGGFFWLLHRLVELWLGQIGRNPRFFNSSEVRMLGKMMFAQAASLGIRLVAVAALKWFLAVVSSEVVFQVPTAVEGAPALVDLAAEL